MKKPRKSGFAPPPALSRPKAPVNVLLLSGGATLAHSTSHTDRYLLLRRPLADPPPPVTLPPDVALVPLAAADAGRIHALLKLAYSSGSGQVTDNLLDWWESVVTDSEFDRNLAFVARHGDEVVGFCLCWTSSFVKDLVVDPRWRNRGVGSALLSTAIEALRKRGADEVALKVTIYNGTAQRLYRQFGFAQE